MLAPASDRVSLSTLLVVDMQRMRCPSGLFTWLHAAHHLRVHLLHLLLEGCCICCTTSLPSLAWGCLLLLLHHELLPHHLLNDLLLVLQR
jgi:hypothetical protein